MLKRVENRLPAGRVTSSTYVKYYSKFLKDATARPLTEGTVNHCRNIAFTRDEIEAATNKNAPELKGRRYRVPRSERVALSLVYTLDECGAWKDVEEKEAERERNQLLSLLGFSYVPRETYVTSVSVAKFLHRAADFARNEVAKDKQKAF